MSFSVPILVDDTFELRPGAWLQKSAAQSGNRGDCPLFRDVCGEAGLSPPQALAGTYP